MLNENIQALRKSKGLSQEELALKLNVVRQTVSKWERGLSVPDAEMLVTIGEVLDTPVSTLLGETVPASEPEGLQALSEKLEVLNDQFAGAQESKRRTLHAPCIAIAAVTALVLIALAAIGGSYLEWDFSNPEYAVAATLLHGFEWIFVRVTPIALPRGTQGNALKRLVSQTPRAAAKEQILEAKVEMRASLRSGESKLRSEAADRKGEIERIAAASRTARTLLTDGTDCWLIDDQNN